MRYLSLLVALSFSFPHAALAESWQDWIKENPTYPIQATPTDPAPSIPQPPALPTTPPSSSTPSTTIANPYPEDYKQGCFASCGTTPEEKVYCTCVMNGLQANYSFAETLQIFQSA
jgi:hypothetical protein